MRKRIEIYRVPVKEHERTYVRIIDEPEYEEQERLGPFDVPKDMFRIPKEIFGIKRRRP